MMGIIELIVILTGLFVALAIPALLFFLLFRFHNQIRELKERVEQLEKEVFH